MLEELLNSNSMVDIIDKQLLEQVFAFSTDLQRTRETPQVLPLLLKEFWSSSSFDRDLPEEHVINDGPQRP